ncbi:MAG: hypothetical protein WBO24_13505 [Nitrospirales bacterium]
MRWYLQTIAAIFVVIEVRLFLTDCCSHMDYGEAIIALKSFIFWPFVDENNVEAVFDKGLGARKLLTLS